MAELKITSFEELKLYAKGDIVSLPPFSEGHPFVARLCRPSLLELIKTGRIPNALVKFANKLFYNSTVTDKNDFDNTDLLAQMYDVLVPIAKASLLEPTYDEIVEAGLTLSDDQLMFIFTYSQNGVNALSSFRTKPGNTVLMRDGKFIQRASK